MSRKELSPEQLDQLAKVAALPDDKIDTTDIPEAPAENWVHARRGELYRPLKQPVTIRLDADVLTWFKEHAVDGGYQTEINRVLRRHVMDVEKRRA
ncbi:MAG: BrnA antitoxin family protein [Bradyrhizobium sp.]